MIIRACDCRNVAKHLTIVTLRQQLCHAIFGATNWRLWSRSCHRNKCLLLHVRSNIASYRVKETSSSPAICTSETVSFLKVLFSFFIELILTRHFRTQMTQQLRLRNLFRNKSRIFFTPKQKADISQSAKLIA